MPSLATATLAEMAMRVHHLAVSEWAAAGPYDLPAIVQCRFAALRAVCADRSRVGKLTAQEWPRGQEAAVPGAGALLSIELDSLTHRAW